MSKFSKWIPEWLTKLIPKMVLPSVGSSISLGQVRDEAGRSGEVGLIAETEDYVAEADTDVTTGDATTGGNLGEDRATMKTTPYALSAFYGWDYSACLTVGTNINMADGSIKLIEDLEEGDEILSAILPGLETAYSEYRIYDLDKVTLSSTKVEQVVFDFSDYYYIINGKLKGTRHPTMAFRNDYYEWWQINDLLVNDKLVTTDLSLDDVVSIERVDKEIEIVGLRVESNNTCFAEGYLVHD
jgi:hypothetical protein